MNNEQQMQKQAETINHQEEKAPMTVTIEQQVLQQQTDTLPQQLNLLQPQQLNGAAQNDPPEIPEQQRQLTEKERNRLEKRQHEQAIAESKAMEKQARQEEKERVQAEKQAEKERIQKAKQDEKNRKEHEKALAQAKIKMDQIYKQMKNDPQMQGEYEGLKPTETFAPRAAYLEQTILSQVKDEAKARELLDKVRTFASYAGQYDHEAHEFRFRTQCLPYYIESVLKKTVSPLIDEQLIRESVDWDEKYYAREMIIKFNELQQEIHSQMTPEQITQQQKGSVRRERMGDYEQKLRELQENENLTEIEARNKFAEQKLREMRPITLQKLEEQRKLHFAEQKEYDETGFQSVDYANQDIKKLDPGAPTLTWEQADKLVQAYLKDVMEKNQSYQIRVPNCDIMQKILESGRFKTQMETNSSMALLNIDVRKDFTKKAFGVEGIPPEKYEIYGYLSHGDMVRESKIDDPKCRVGLGAGQYGQVVVKLKNSSMKNRTTTLIGDSLSGHASSHVAWVQKPDMQSVTAKNRTDMIKAAYFYDKKKQDPNGHPEEDTDLDAMLELTDACYAELQYHGGVSAGDIESITLITDYQADPGVPVDKEIPGELLDKLKELGIKTTIVSGGEEHEV